MTNYLRYSPDIERPAPDEQDTIDGIIRGMTEQSRVVEEREQHAVRASHAKSTACVVGEFTVEEGLPPELAQGLFATPGTHPVAVRFAQGPGETLGDRVSTHRGMSIKVFGVPGEKLGGHAVDTQDFVLATGTTFPSGTAAGFLRDGTVIGKSTGLPEGVKSAVSSGMRNLNRVLHAFGTESAFADFSATRSAIRSPTAISARRRSGSATTSRSSGPSRSPRRNARSPGGGSTRTGTRTGSGTRPWSSSPGTKPYSP